MFTSLAKQSSEIALIDVCEPVQAVIDQASRCEAILASALHGLILADSLGIANQWVRLSGEGRDAMGTYEFKYRDYYSVFGLEDLAPIALTEESTLDTLLPLIPVLRRPGLERVQLEVLRAFPMMRGEV